MTSKQRAYLKSIAMTTEPILQIGKARGIAQLVSCGKQLRVKAPQSTAQNDGDPFGIQHRIADGACDGKIFTDRLIFKFRPKNTGHIQKLNVIIHHYPLLFSGNSRAVFHLSLFLPCHTLLRRDSG